MVALDERVMKYLALPVTGVPDDAFNKIGPRARRAIIEGYNYDAYDPISTMIGIGIVVRFLDIETELGSSNRPFTAGYNNSTIGEEKLERLKEFVDSIRGEEVGMVYGFGNTYRPYDPILNMIAPLQPGQLYVRGLQNTDGLVPYQLKPEMLVG